MAVHVKNNVLALAVQMMYISIMPKKTERTFDTPLQIRVTTEQAEMFQKAAKKDQRSVSNWARDRLEKAAKAELTRIMSNNL